VSYGWAGQILRVNLTERKVTKEPLPRDWGARFIGAAGINDWILYNEVGPEVDPLSPENRLIIGAGPLNGTIVPIGSRTSVTTRSPLTGNFGDANGGGFWSSTLKYAGYDHIVVQGKADKPVYLWIDDEDVVIRDASRLWGKDVFETDDLLKAELGRDIQTAAIGPAGENLVRYANIMFDRYRAAAKTGVGCVMGSKNLKAIAVRGTGAIEVADPDKLRKYAEAMRDSLDIRKSKGAAAFAKYGTTTLVLSYNADGCLSVNNYQGVDLDPQWLEDIHPDKFLAKYAQRNTSCSVNCPTHCCHWWRIPDGRFAGEAGAKPEYIVMDAMGIHLGVRDLSAILHFQNLVNRMGMDASEMGTGIGLLMELWQRGVITGADTGGMTVPWGDVDAIETLVQQTARRQGFGQVLSDGTVKAADKIGRDAIKYVCHSKGMTEVEDVRAYPGWALAYAISTRGADHLKAHNQIDKQSRKDISQAIFGAPDVGIGNSPSLKGKSAAYHEDFEALSNSLGGCMFNWLSLSLKYNPKQAVQMPDYAPVFSAATGVELTGEEISRCGERIVLLEKAFNARLGLTRKDDTLHGRWMNELCPSGTGKGMKAEDYLEPLLDEYYTARGFDVKTGLPTRATLAKAGLESVAADLEKRGVI